MNADIAEAQRVFQTEIQGLNEVQKKLSLDFSKAIDLIVECRGKIIVSGMGKSGHIGRKMAATFSSTGTPSLFLHPAESSHGDMGVITSDDVLLLVSYGGGSQELNDLLSFSQRKGIPLIGISGNPKSPLAQHATVFLDISVSEEACPLGLAPTSSSTATLVLGDALAMACLRRKGFKENDFAEYHPGGKLGRRLLTRVTDIMTPFSSMPKIPSQTIVRQALSTMTKGEVRGVVAVIDDGQKLVGSLTDGDLRRHLEKSQSPLDSTVLEVMGHSPKTIDKKELASKAMFLMEKHSISSLFVVDSSSENLEGLIHLHDLIKAKI